MFKIPYLAAAAALALVGFASWQDPEPAASQDPTEQQVRKLLDLTGSAAMGEQAMHQMLESFRAMPGLPEGFIEKFKELAKPEELTAMVVPIYKKHLDQETIEAAIAFAESEAGRKFHAAQPKIVEESMAAGTRWGQDLAKRVIAELRAEERDGEGR